MSNMMSTLNTGWHMDLFNLLNLLKGNDGQDENPNASTDSGAWSSTRPTHWIPHCQEITRMQFECGFPNGGPVGSGWQRHWIPRFSLASFCTGFEGWG